MLRSPLLISVFLLILVLLLTVTTLPTLTTLTTLTLLQSVASMGRQGQISLQQKVCVFKLFAYYSFMREKGSLCM
jgi:hypothetical protein